MTFPAIVSVECEKESLTFETLSKTYSLYKFSQDGDDCRGLITRTLNYQEYLIFCLKANPLSTYERLYDWNKMDNSINNFLKKIPKIEHRELEPLHIEKELYDKIYTFMMDYGLLFEKVLLYNVFLMSKTKNPHFTHYNLEHYKYEPRTWLHPPTTEIPLTTTEEKLIKINHIQRQIQYDIKNTKTLETYYKSLDVENKNILRNIKRIENELNDIEYKVNKISEEVITNG